MIRIQLEVKNGPVGLMIVMEALGVIFITKPNIRPKYFNNGFVNAGQGSTIGLVLD